MRIEGLERLTDGRCLIRWPSVAGRLYQILVSDSAVSGFHPLVEDLPATAPANVFTAPPITQAQAFFRLEVI